MKSMDIIYCRTEEFAEEIREFYVNKGYTVMQLTLEIETGTHGKHVVKRLDILTKFDWVNKGKKTKI